MIKISAIFLIFFLGMSNCLDLTASSGVILPSMESKQQLFDMMVQVRTEKNTNTLKGFAEQLHEMLEKLEKAQAKHQKIHKKMMKQCIAEDKFRKSEINTAKTSKGAAQRALSRCRVSLKNAKKELPQLEKTAKSYDNELKRGVKAREFERKKFIQRRQSLTEAIAFLRTFIRYVKKKTKSYGVSLVSMSQDLLKHSNKLNLLIEAAPILASIAMETVSKDTKDNYKFHPNDELKQRLNTALAKLLNRLKLDEKTNRKDEAKAASLFASYKSKLERIINTLVKNIKRVKIQINKMKKCMDTEGGIIAKALNKLKRNSKLRGNANKMCISFNKGFIHATHSRLDEISTMNEIIKIVKRRFKKIPSDLVSYLESVSDKWRAYINSTTFKKYVAYQRKWTRDNIKGKLLAKKHAENESNPLAAHVRGSHGID